MKLGMAQMSMFNNMDGNYRKTLSFIEQAADCDLLFFPEIQLTPFFPQVKGLNTDAALSRETDARLNGIAYQAKKYDMYVSPNVYLEKNGRRYDASLWYDGRGKSHEIAKMVHVTDRHRFHEAEYYSPSEDGYVVHETRFGKIGIVICYDRHFPESFRTCVLKGADLIIIPAANIKEENMELYEWELRTAAYQNGVFIAMCNRVGKEGKMIFAGESIVIDPNGDVILKADDTEQLLKCKLDLSAAAKVREERPFLAERRPKLYER